MLTLSQMPQPDQVLQPQYFGRFRCLGAECEDTCCDGWGILIDRATFEKYQGEQTRNPLAPYGALGELVEINPAGSSSADYAKIRLSGTRCPALADGMCSVQQAHGEPWISDMCSSFPRIFNRVGAVTERSLHLSCPEAARLVLLDPEAMVFEELKVESAADRPNMVSTADDPAGCLQSARTAMVRILKERSRPVWLRMAALGLAVDRFADLEIERAPAVLEEYGDALAQGLLDGILRQEMNLPASQLETVLELVVARIGAEYTSPRFLDCYRDFMRGLEWTGESTMEQLAARYSQANRTGLEPFLEARPWLVENYLINYVIRSWFPWGRRLPDQKLTLDRSGASIRNAWLLMATHYGVIRTLLIGMSAAYEGGLTDEYAVKLVQSCTKVFQHSGSVAASMLDFLARQPGDPFRNAIALMAD